MLGILYLPLVLLSALVAWRAAPDIEGFLFPVLTDLHYVPYDAAHPSKFVENQLDRVCWKLHFRKARTAETLRWDVTFIEPDGTRHFSEPIDARTGESFSTRDSRPRGYVGDVPLCAIMPDNFDASDGYTIETYAQYEPPHHLWPIEQFFPILTVPPAFAGSG